jgi:hypothetical protein
LVRKRGRIKGKSEAKALIGASAGNAEQGQVGSLGLAGLNAPGRLWDTRAVPSCLVPGPVDLGQDKYWLGVDELRKEVGGAQPWISQSAHERQAPDKLFTTSRN